MTHSSPEMTVRAARIKINELAVGYLVMQALVEIWCRAGCVAIFIFNINLDKHLSWWEFTQRKLAIVHWLSADRVVLLINTKDDGERILTSEWKAAVLKQSPGKTLLWPHGGLSPFFWTRASVGVNELSSEIRYTKNYEFTLQENIGSLLIYRSHNR